LFFFSSRRRHTRSKRDWSSDVCSSDLTSEELGIPATHIYVIIPLDYIVSHFGRIIYPYMGRVINYGQMSPNPYEVEEIFTVPLRSEERRVGKEGRFRC